MPFFFRARGERENGSGPQTQDDLGGALEVIVRGSAVNSARAFGTASSQLLACTFESLFVHEHVRPALQEQPVFVAPKVIMREWADVLSRGAACKVRGGRTQRSCCFPVRANCPEQMHRRAVDCAQHPCSGAHCQTKRVGQKGHWLTLGRWVGVVCRRLNAGHQLSGTPSQIESNFANGILHGQRNVAGSTRQGRFRWEAVVWHRKVPFGKNISAQHKSHRPRTGAHQ